MTLKGPGYTGMEYCSFEKWEDADKAPRVPLRWHNEKYFCAPQVFYYTPHKLWYMIYQVRVGDEKGMQIAYSTTNEIGKPDSWSKPQWLFPDAASDKRTVAGIDFWVICDETKAYMFFTSNDGKMWRMWTTREEFPRGFRDCKVALEADIFEASHTYRLKGRKEFLTIIEANPRGKRRYDAFVSDRLDGEWKPLGEKGLFASDENVRPAAGVTMWADNISHGELLRQGADESLTVDPENMRFLIQGVLQKDKIGAYGDIPWRIGMLEPIKKE
jgi:hypothetical protein